MRVVLVEYIFSIYFLHCCFAIQINFVKVPMAVRNNSGKPAILDCDYSVRPDDSDLVVKWFLDDEPVYQWIPPQKPQSMGKMKDRVDLNFKATEDPRSVYRALKILNPTSDLAGQYKCFVSTFADEDFSIKRMIVFEVEKSLAIHQSTDGKTVNFTCSATEVYPAAKLVLFKDKKDDLYSKNLLNSIQWDTTRLPNDKFNVFVIAVSPFNVLKPGTLIHCELKIPGTAYIKRKSLLYYPEGVELNKKNILLQMVCIISIFNFI